MNLPLRGVDASGIYYDEFDQFDTISPKDIEENTDLFRKLIKQIIKLDPDGTKGHKEMIVATIVDEFGITHEDVEKGIMSRLWKVTEQEGKLRAVRALGITKEDVDKSLLLEL